MNAIGTFTPAQLRTIREAVHGPSETEIFKSEKAAAPDDGMKDVLILAPEGESLFKSSDASLTRGLEQRGVQVQESFPEVGISARADESTLKSLEEEGYQIFDNSPRQLWPGIPKGFAPMTQQDWSMPKVDPVGWLGADKLHESGITGAGQVVAVLDSGFDHPDFQLKAWKDVVDGNESPVDRVGHGTHCAHDVLQTAPGAEIVAVKVMGDDGTGRPSDIIRGIQWAVQQKLSGKLDIEVINMSLGGPPDGFPDSIDPVNRAVEAANRAGITVVAAAGNSGPDGHTIGSPADAKSALAVGAALNPNTVSDFSSRGPTDDGLIKPDVMAPGEFISAWSVPGSEMEQTAQAVEALRQMSGDELKQLLTENPDMAEALGLPPEILELPGEELEQLIKPALPPVFIPAEGLVAAPGTSFASPLVAGVVAGLEQAVDSDPATLRDVLKGTADSMGDFTGEEQGAGFVDAPGALEELRRRSQTAAA